MSAQELRESSQTPQTPEALEREIAVLTRRVESANLELAGLREHGPEPRGVAPGVIAGMLVVVAGFIAFICWAGVAVEMLTG